MTKIISFYSYKGGAGRSVCVANIIAECAKLLKASGERPILLVDFDLDSAGLSILLETHVGYNQYWTSTGIVECNPDFFITTTLEQFGNCTIDISRKVGAAQNTVRFIRVANIEQGSNEARLSQAVENFRRLIAYCKKVKIPAIVIDASCGRQMSARIIHRISDVIVYCTRLSYQFAIGTEQQINHFIEEGTMDDYTELPSILLLPVAVPKEVNKWSTQKNARYDTYKRIVQEIGQKVNCVLIEDGIPEHERFKWHEKILVALSKEERDDEDEMMICTFNKVAKCIVENMK